MPDSAFGVLISLITLIAIAWFLPETLRRRAPRTKPDLLRPFRLAGSSGALRDQPVVQGIMGVDLFQSAAMAAYVSIMIYYLIDQLGLGEAQVGNFLFVVGAFAIFNQMVMIGPIVAALGSARALGLGLSLPASGSSSWPCAVPACSGLRRRPPRPCLAQRLS